MVSVVIPTYGHADYVLRTLDSVFAQTHRDFEVIVVNDGSPDDTARVLAPLADEGRIRYYEIANQGVAGARNFGVSQARGEFIALLDDDDLWPPDKLAWQVELLRQDDSLLGVSGSATFMGPDDVRKERDDSDRIHNMEVEEFFEGNQIYSPGQVLLRSSVFQEVGNFDGRYWGGDDLSLWIRLVEKGRLLWKDHTALYYRVHTANASGNHLRMLRTLGRLILTHSESLSIERRRYCRRVGFRWLFKYMGRNTLWDARFRLVTRRPRIAEGFENLRGFLRVLGGPALRDWNLLSGIILLFFQAFVVTPVQSILGVKPREMNPDSPQ